MKKFLDKILRRFGYIHVSDLTKSLKEHLEYIVNRHTENTKRSIERMDKIIKERPWKKN